MFGMGAWELRWGNRVTSWSLGGVGWLGVAAPICAVMEGVGKSEDAAAVVGFSTGKFLALWEGSSAWPDCK